MFKNFKFKDILLAVLTAVVGWLGASEAYTYATGGPGDGQQGKLIRTPKQEAPEQPGLYTVQASFYVVRPVKVGNFTDGTTNSDIGAYVLHVAKPSPSIVLGAFFEAYGQLYPAAEVGAIQVLKEPDGEGDGGNPALLE